MSLNKNQKSIIKYLSKGFTTAEIARIMGLKQSKVSTQISLLVKAFDCKTTIELMHKLTEANNNKKLEELNLEIENLKKKLLKAKKYVLELNKIIDFLKRR